MSVDWESLKFKPMTRFTSSKYNALIDAVKSIGSDVSARVKYDDLSRLAYSIIPDQSGTRDLGSSTSEWRTIYASTGHFSGGLYVQGKQVIKDGDPVDIGDISDTAKAKLSQAIDSASFNQAVSDIKTALNSLFNAVSEVGSLVLLDYTTTPLGADESWVSLVDSSLNTGRVVGSVYSDVPGTLYVEQSPDGSNWDIVDSFSVPGGQGVKFSVEKVCQCARVRYVNGSTAQSVFRLYAYRRVRAI